EARALDEFPLLVVLVQDLEVDEELRGSRAGLGPAVVLDPGPVLAGGVGVFVHGVSLLGVVETVSACLVRDLASLMAAVKAACSGRAPGRSPCMAKGNP